MSCVNRAILPLTLLAILAMTLIAPHVGAQSVGQRAIPVPIKVVLVGLDQVNTDYMSWSKGSSGNLPAQITNQVIFGNSTGEIFYPQYTVVKAPATVKQELESYLNSIEKDVQGPNPWFGRYIQDKTNPDYCVWQNVTMNYAVYDANSVESWLWSHNQELGGSSNVGWTIVVSYLPKLPSITWNDVKNFERTKYDNPNKMNPPASKPHYYGISAVDRDLGYALRYRDFMDAWGGKQGRMWFIDLSAGPVINSQWEDLPLQVVLGDNNMDLSSGFGQQWLAEYVSDYVWQATYNFITPDFVYYPYYRPNYQIDVSVLDDRNVAEKRAVPIENTISRQPIQAAFQELVPYSNVTVNVNFVDVSPELDQIVRSAYKYTDSWLSGSEFCQPERYGVVDVRPVYNYMLAHVGAYEGNSFLTQDKVTIPVFAFAFSNEIYFTYSYKWFIGKTDSENGALLGIALDHAVFISYNQYEFTRGDQVTPRQPGKGEGFTETVIHEVGHEFGLMHPHQFGDIGDFVYSAMGYFTNDYSFGQIDKDSIQRAHVDQVYFATQNIMKQLPSDAASQVQAKLAAVDASYAAMNYVDAMHAVISAYQLAQQLLGSVNLNLMYTGSMSVTTPASTSSAAGEPNALYIAVGVVVGLVVGLTIAMVVLKKPSNESKTKVYGRP